jgi:hypothetical protein
MPALVSPQGVDGLKVNRRLNGSAMPCETGWSIHTDHKILSISVGECNEIIKSGGGRGGPLPRDLISVSTFIFIAIDHSL